MKSGSKQKSENWTIQIRSDKPLLDFRFAEIVDYRDLIWLFVKRDLVVTYKQTVLGPIWVVLSPVLTTILFSIVFGRVVGISTEGVPIILFYMLGVLSWGFFSDCFTSTSRTFIANVDIFSKIYFPRSIVPFSSVLSAGIRLLIQLAVFISVFAYYLLQGEVKLPGSNVLLCIPLFLILAFLGLGLGFLYSSITSKYRDLLLLLPFVVQLFMYLSPVVYPVSEIPEEFRGFIDWNPLTPVFGTMRYIWFGSGSLDNMVFWYSAVVASIMFIFGLLAFHRVERKFLDTV